MVARKEIQRKKILNLRAGQTGALALRFYTSAIRGLRPLVRAKTLFLDTTCQRFKPQDGQGY